MPPRGSSPASPPRLQQGRVLLPLRAGSPAARRACSADMAAPAPANVCVSVPTRVFACPLGCAAGRSRRPPRGQARTALRAGWPPALQPLDAQAFVPASAIVCPVATQATYCGCAGRARKRPGPAERPRCVTCCRGFLTRRHQRAKPEPRAGRRARGSGPNSRPGAGRRAAGQGRPAAPGAGPTPPRHREEGPGGADRGRRSGRGAAP